MTESKPLYTTNNAKDIDISQIGKPKFLLIGGHGAGKSSQILTLPGRTFLYIFDPAALSTYKGFDIEYAMFVPSVVSLAAQSLTKGKGDPKNLTDVDAHLVYHNWEKDFEARYADGFFAPFDNIAFDSFTTFADIVMDRVLHINGRAGQWPQQDDWTAQMNAIRSVIRTLAGQADMTLVCTGHEDAMVDETTHRVINQIILTGKLRAKIPLLFSDVWHLYAETKADGNTAYWAQTKPDRTNPSIRCSFRDLENKIDITIDWRNHKNYGIGKLMKDHGLVKLKADSEKEGLGG